VIHSNVKLRVDTKDIWNVDDVVRNIQATVSGQSAVAGFVIPVSNEFLNQLRYGDTLRIKIEDLSAFRASLSGSRSAINRAIALYQEIAGSTKVDDKYFERRPAPRPDDESYF